MSKATQLISGIRIEAKAEVEGASSTEGMPGLPDLAAARGRGVRQGWGVPHGSSPCNQHVCCKHGHIPGLEGPLESRELGLGTVSLSPSVAPW